MVTRSPIAGSIRTASRRSSTTMYDPLSYGGTRHCMIRIARAYRLKLVRARSPDREDRAADRGHAGPARVAGVTPHGELVPLPRDVRRYAHLRAWRACDRRRRPGRPRAGNPRAGPHRLLR